MTSDVHTRGVEELRAAYEQGDTTPTEVVGALLDRVRALDPKLNAFVTVAPAAEREAEQATRDLAAGRTADQPLLGIPVSIKDLVPTKGLRTTMGSLTRADWVPDYDPPVVERLRAAGAVVLGKTNTCEYGWKGDAGNRIIGPTRNPWDLARTSGGSSGGAAAAVAAGLGPVAIGTDGAGSVRIPAAFCGVFGLKPSFGRIPYVPTSGVPLFSHCGVLARSVVDAALLLDVVSGADERDALSFDLFDGRLRARATGQLTRPYRLAWCPRLGATACEPEVLARVEAAAGVFATLGCTVDTVDPGVEDPWPLLDALWAASHAARHNDDLDEVRPLLDPGLLEVIEHGHTMTGVDVAAALITRSHYVAQMRTALAGFDGLLSPTLPTVAFAAGLDQPGRVSGRTTEYLEWTPFTYPWNITGQPAATVPAGHVGGLPVGLQIVGRWRDDGTVIELAAAFEAARPWERLAPLGM